MKIFICKAIKIEVKFYNNLYIYFLFYSTQFQKKIDDHNAPMILEPKKKNKTWNLKHKQIY